MQSTQFWKILAAKSRQIHMSKSNHGTVTTILPSCAIHTIDMFVCIAILTKTAVKFCQLFFDFSEKM